jgi:hypothetical protein
VIVLQTQGAATTLTDAPIARKHDLFGGGRNIAALRNADKADEQNRYKKEEFFHLCW